LTTKQVQEFKETEIGKIPADWEVTELGNFADITKLAGYEFTKLIKYTEDGEIIAIRSLNVKDGFLDLTNIKKISRNISDALPRSKLFLNDVLLTYTGSLLGDVALIDRNDTYHLAPNVCRLRIKNEGMSLFLMYYLRSTIFQNFLHNYTVGSGQPTIPMKNIRIIKIPNPKISEQKKIVKYLLDLDTKIQNLQDQNKVLEQTAQAIFQSWFVDFDGVTEFEDSELGQIPKGWKVDNLFNCANYVNGSAFSVQDSSPFQIGKAIIKITELKYGINSKTLFTEKNMDSKYDLYNGDILFAWSGSPDTSIDTFIWTGGNAILNQHIHKINLKYSKDKPFIYFLFKYLNKKFIEIARDKQTTGLGHVTIGDMKKLLVILPSGKFRGICIKHFNPIFNILCNNKIEIGKLTKTRDILLPKLMSGEIRV
jgi:type I restriction enzyme, S subunit